MNKETRQFIWGLILLMLGGLAVAESLIAIFNGTWDGGVNNVLLSFSLYGVVVGGYYISKNV